MPNKNTFNPARNTASTLYFMPNSITAADGLPDGSGKHGEWCVPALCRTCSEQPELQMHHEPKDESP